MRPRGELHCRFRGRVSTALSSPVASGCHPARLPSLLAASASRVPIGRPTALHILYADCMGCHGTADGAAPTVTRPACHRTGTGSLLGGTPPPGAPPHAHPHACPVAARALLEHVVPGPRMSRGPVFPLTGISLSPYRPGAPEGRPGASVVGIRRPAFLPGGVGPVAEPVAAPGGPPAANRPSTGSRRPDAGPPMPSGLPYAGRLL